MSAMIARVVGLRIYAYVAAAALAIGFAAGWHVESERFAEFRGGVDAIGRAAEADAQRRTQDRQRITKEANDAYRRKTTVLNAAVADLRRELREHASRSVLPEPVAPAGSGGAGEVDGGIVCFARDQLRAGLARALERFAGGFEERIQRGAGAIANFEACAEWALKQHEAAR